MNIIYNMNNIKFASELQKNIVNDNSNLKLINGCAGSRKTETLIMCGIRNIYEHLAEDECITKIPESLHQNRYN